MRQAVLATRLLPDRDCATCTAFNQERWGCEADVPAGEELRLGGEEFARCPRRPIKEDPERYSMLFWLYSNYAHRGHLPCAGGLADQPGVLVDAFRVMDAASATADALERAGD